MHFGVVSIDFYMQTDLSRLANVCVTVEIIQHRVKNVCSHDITQLTKVNKTPATVHGIGTV